jgi:hypothetical protein
MKSETSRINTAKSGDFCSASKTNMQSKRKISFLLLLIIGLVLGIVIKNIKIGMIIGIAIGLFAGSLGSKKE